MAPRISTSLPASARVGAAFLSPTPRHHLDHISPTHSHVSLTTTPRGRQGHPRFTDEPVRLRAEKHFAPGLVMMPPGTEGESGGHPAGQVRALRDPFTKTGASPPGKRVSAFCIRASTTPTTWMEDTEAASSWAWSLGQKGAEVSHPLCKLLAAPTLRGPRTVPVARKLGDPPVDGNQVTHSPKVPPPSPPTGVTCQRWSPFPHSSRI